MSVTPLIGFLDFAFLAAKGDPPSTKDRIFSICFLVLFGIIGIVLLRAGVRELFKIRSRRPFLVTLPGTVLSIYTQRESRGGTAGSSETGVVLRFIPIVMFHTPEGKRVEFRSEVCDIHHLRIRHDGSLPQHEPSWRPGQQVEVIYDTGGVLKPHLAGGAGMGFIGWGMIAAGLVTCGVVIGLGFVFWSRVSR